MKFKQLHKNFKLPTKGTIDSAALDIYMPEAGSVFYGGPLATEVPLGFCAEVPEGHVGLLLPRSGKGAMFGLELNNTCGVIDHDYRGEWKAYLRLKNPGDTLNWEEGDRLLQLLIMPVESVEPVLVDSLDATTRTGGFNSTGN